MSGNLANFAKRLAWTLSNSLFCEGLGFPLLLDVEAIGFFAGMGFLRVSLVGRPSGTDSSVSTGFTDVADDSCDFSVSGFELLTSFVRLSGISGLGAFSGIDEFKGFPANCMISSLKKI